MAPTTGDNSHDWFHFHERARSGRPALLGIGSFEAHGPHLPLDTDTIIADALVRELSARLGATALPTLPFGALSRPRSGGGDLFPLPALRLPTLYGVVEDLVRGACSAGISRLAILTGHFENSAILWDAAHEATQHCPIDVVLFDAPWELIPPAQLEALSPEGGLDWAADHAGLLETAVMKHLAPEKVGSAPPPWTDGRRRQYDVLPTPEDAVPRTGVVNDARQATAEAGAACFEAMVRGMHQAVYAEGWPVPDPSNAGLAAAPLTSQKTEN